MAIQSGAQQGIEVTTAAMDETLASQTQANGVDEIVVSDVIGTAGNGNITAPTGYVGRLCILREGETDEETRLITGEVAGTGTTRILTVAEDWDSIPVVTTDTIHVSYSSDDMEAFTGMTLNSKTGVYEGGSTREWQIGLGTNFAYVAVFDYTGWEITDRGSTEPGLTVRNNGRLDFGYIQGGAPIQGAIVTSTNNVDGELQIEIEAGGIFRAYATVFRSWVNLVGFILRATADVETRNATIKDYTQDLLLLVGTHKDLTVAGNSTLAELVRIAEETVINGLVLAGTAGLATEDADTTTETLLVRDGTYLSNITNIQVNSNKTWNVVNPVWTIPTVDFTGIRFLTATSNEVNEKYSIDPTVQDAAGTKINGARVFVYEGLRLDDLVQELTSDANGLAPGSWVFKNFNDAATGVAEVSTVTTVADVSSSLVNTFFLIDQPLPFGGGGFYVWYDDGLTGADPLVAGRTGIQVIYAPNDTANTIASLTDTAVNGTAGFGSSVSTNVVTVTNDDKGVVTDLVDGSAATGFSFAVTTQGVSDSLTVLTDGDHAIRIDNYGDFPFIAAQVSNVKFSGAVVLSPDPTISEANQATAITAGSGVLFNTDTNPSELFDFTLGTGTLADGMIITFSPSGAVGTITESVSGDSVAGTIHLNARDATAIANGDTFTRTGGTAGSFSGTYTNDTTQSFSKWVDGNSLTMQIIHDYFAARTAEASGGFTAEAEIIHEWGKENEPRVVQLGSGGWFTNRSDGEGIFIADRGAGDIDFFTDDAGVQFTPPVSISLTFSGLRDNTEVRVYETGTTTELVGIENATDGSSDDRSVTFALTASTIVDIRFAHGTAADGNIYTVPPSNSILAFTWPTVTGTLPITQVLDRSFDDPV